jgi:hypothetical protein
VKPPKLILTIADKMGFDVTLDTPPKSPTPPPTPTEPPTPTTPLPTPTEPPTPTPNSMRTTSRAKTPPPVKIKETPPPVVKETPPVVRETPPPVVKETQPKPEIKQIKESEPVKKAITATVQVKDYVSENLTYFIGGIVCILIVMVIAVFAVINWGDMKTRVARIAEISGEVTIETDTRIKPASKNQKINPGDIITLSKDARVRIKIDPDKFITVEPESSLYLDYTNIEGMGSITVNLLYGSAITEISGEIGTKDKFLLLTPNAMIDVRKSVFKTNFEYFADYGGNPAKITTVEDFSGNLNLQLYDDYGNKADNLMILKEKNSAKLVTTPDTALYNGLNLEITLEDLPQFTLTEILRISNNFTPLAYSTIELNNALKTVAERNYVTASSVTPPETISTTPYEPIILPPVTEPPNAPGEDEIIITTTPETKPQPLPTTQTLGEMTTYTGAKWWEMTNTGAESDDISDETGEENDENPFAADD